MSLERRESCPSEPVLESLARGKLSASECEQIEGHLSGCADCCLRLDALGGAEFEACFAAEPIDSEGEHNAALTSLMEALCDEVRGSGGEIGDAVALSGGGEAGATLEAGDMLGPYEIITEVGRGGMGTVYKAHDVSLRRTVAIKTLSPALASSRRSRERFLREARAVAQVQHDHVMPIYAVEQSVAVPYLVTPFVEGLNLQQRLDGGKDLSIEEVRSLVTQIAAALEEAHRHGVIHRDVKPANIMLRDESLRVWLADFGLARAFDDPSITQENVLAGTPEYMAPEQVEGRELDHRVDLFALGALIYSMVTGKSPFQADTTLSAMHKVQKVAPPSLRGLRDDVPIWLDQLVEKLLQKDPEDRPQSAAEVRRILEAGTAPGTATRENKAVPPVWLLGGTGAILTAILLVVAPDFIARRGDGDSTRLPEASVRIPGYYLESTGNAVYASLSDAVRAARPGDTVWVCQSKVSNVATVSIDGKPLTVRAGRGYAPVFASRSARETVLQSDAPIRLEGIEFRQPVPGAAGRASPVVRFRSGPVYMANCRVFRASRERPRPRGRFAVPAVLEFVDCEAVHLVNSEVYTVAGSSLAWRATRVAPRAEARLTNNVIVGQLGLALKSEAAAGVTWRLDRNTVASSIAFSAWGDPGLFPPIEMDMRRNVFDVRVYWLWLRDGRLQQAKVMGEGNLFHANPRVAGDPVYFVSRSALPERSSVIEPDSIVRFEQFRKFAGPIGDNAVHPVLHWGAIEPYRGNFALVKGNLFGLTDAYSTAVTTTGVMVEQLGPGEAYERWCTSDAYAAWAAQPLD